MGQQYSPEFKNQLIKEARDTGNAALVARQHQVKESALYAWIRQAKHSQENKKEKKVKNLEQQLDEKEREIEILKELLKKTNQAWLGGSRSLENSSTKGGGK